MGCDESDRLPGFPLQLRDAFARGLHGRLQRGIGPFPQFDQVAIALNGFRHVAAFFVQFAESAVGVGEFDDIDIAKLWVSRNPFALAAVVGLKQMEFSQPVTFLIGENGSGKSTMLEAIAVALGLNAEG